MNTFEKYCLSSFDIVILNPPDGVVNKIILGASTNYFGTLLRGKGRFITPYTDFTIYEGDTVFIPKGCVYRSEWYGTPTPLFYSLPYIMLSDGADDMRFALQGIYKSFPCGNLTEHMRVIHDGKKDNPAAALAEFYKMFEKVLPLLRLEKRTVYNASVMPALRYIDAHACDEFDIPFLASMCCMSESSFYTLFKKQTGMTPIAYKNRMRCIRAAELLRNSDYTVEYISAKLNFSSPAYMRRVMKEFTGKTPGEIRRRNTDMI